MEKITPISGDTALPDLGISDQDRCILIENTSIVIHSAALLRMDATLKDAINVNTEGTLRLLKLAAEMRNLMVRVDDLD